MVDNRNRAIDLRVSDLSGGDLKQKKSFFQNSRILGDRKCLPRTEQRAECGPKALVASLGVVRQFSSSIRELDFPDLITSQIEYLNFDVSSKLKK